MCRFLRFTVEQAIEGRAGELKEYLIGIEVFDRKATYDPRVDPIVRVEARRLRAKLQQYYRSAGGEDPIRIEFPTGSYVPQFLSPVPETVASQPKAGAGKTIAVLPFANLSNEPGSEYFSDGLTSELIHALTKAEGLNVVAWTSAAQWKGRAYDLKDIGRQLQADVVLEGSVRHAQNNVRIMVQLIDAATGFYLWSESYNREMSDIFAIQEEIANSIVSVLRIRLRARHVPGARRETDIESYHRYLKGRYHWNKRTREGLLASVDFFQEAIQRDPNYALAYAGLADAWSLLVEFGLHAAGDLMPQAKTAALKALELDSTLAEAYTSLAFIRSLYDWEWTEAEGHYRRAITLNPGYATVHHWFSVDFLALHGRMDEALGEIKLARQLDPLSIILNESYGYVLLLCRRFEEALHHYSRLIEKEPGFYRAHTGLGRIFGFLGRYDDSISAYLRGRHLAPEVPSIAGALGQTYARAGREDEARRELQLLHEMSGRAAVSPTCFALIHAGLGENARAMDFLEEARDRRELPLTSVGVHPAYDSLREEPRFQKLLKRVGLAR
ncbi:MAG: hypothetical protein IT165_05510 [Bryobacterales bacterium]|nr:hypothetical protein [Bryobacterales bacterium]